MSRNVVAIAILVLVSLCISMGVEAQGRKKKKAAEDPYVDIVWPPPPAEARIKLEAVFRERRDIEASGRLRSILIGVEVGPYDILQKPHAVDFDSQGRILVTDQQTGALVRIDRREGRWDVLGTQGLIRLKKPLGLGIGPGDVAYVADVGLGQVIALDSEGSVVSTYGGSGEFTNPVDAAVSPDGSKLFVADSKAHRIHVLDIDSGVLERSFGRRGEGPGEFAVPSSLAFGPEGFLYVVDSLNGRVQMLEESGDFVDSFGQLGIGMGSFTRPKGIAVDEVGFIYVVDNAFNNVQLFDIDFTLLTFVGEGGESPGRFWGASGVGVRGNEFAVVDQLGRRVQVFRFLVPKEQ